MSNQTTADVELERVERQVATAKWEALQRLKEEKDFKLLVSEGYLKEEAVRLTSMLATEYVRQYNLRSTIFESLAAISIFEDYMNTIDSLGGPVEDEDDEDITE